MFKECEKILFDLKTDRNYSYLATLIFFHNKYRYINVYNMKNTLLIHITLIIKINIL